MKKRTLALLSALLCAVSLAVPARAAGEDAAQTVLADLYFLKPLKIYYDEIEPLFVNEQNVRLYPLGYQGSIYIPLRTAGEWLGKEVSWDQDTLTVSLSGSGDPLIKNSIGAETRSTTDEEVETMRNWAEHGVQAQLRTDITILVDGEERQFYNVNGEPVIPLVFNGSVYLPVRGISELCGRNVTFSIDNEYQYIYINNTVDNGELEELQNYFDQIITLGDKAARNCILFEMLNFQDHDEGLRLLKEIDRDVTELLSIEPPDTPYQSQISVDLEHTFGEEAKALKGYIQELENGAELSSFALDFSVADPNQPRDPSDSLYGTVNWIGYTAYGTPITHRKLLEKFMGQTWQAPPSWPELENAMIEQQPE